MQRTRRRSRGDSRAHLTLAAARQPCHFFLSRSCHTPCPMPHAPFPLSQNELATLEFIHCFVEVLDKHFGQVGGRRRGGRVQGDGA